MLTTTMTWPTDIFVALQDQSVRVVSSCVAVIERLPVRLLTVTPVFRARLLSPTPAFEAAHAFAWPVRRCVASLCFFFAAMASQP